MASKIQLDFQSLNIKERSKIVKSAVSPRPVAWITTLNENGTINLAPFSFFNVVANNMLSVSFISADDKYPDTLHNILRNREAVVNIVSLEMLDLLHESSFPYEREMSETDILNIPLDKNTTITTPSVQLSKVSFETSLNQHIPVYDSLGFKQSDLIILEISGVSIDESIYNKEKNYIDFNKLNPVTRLGGHEYGISKVYKTIKR